MEFQSLTLMQRSLRPWGQGRLHLFPQHAEFPEATAVASRAGLKVRATEDFAEQFLKW